MNTEFTSGNIEYTLNYGQNTATIKKVHVYWDSDSDVALPGIIKYNNNLFKVIGFQNNALFQIERIIKSINFPYTFEKMAKNKAEFDKIIKIRHG